MHLILGHPSRRIWQSSGPQRRPSGQLFRSFRVSTPSHRHTFTSTRQSRHQMDLCTRLRELVSNCLNHALYQSAIFYSDKLVSLSGGAPEDRYLLAKVRWLLKILIFKNSSIYAVASVGILRFTGVQEGLSCAANGGGSRMAGFQTASNTFKMPDRAVYGSLWRMG